MDREKLKEIIIDQNQKRTKIDYIPRDIMPKIEENLNNRFIIIVSGIRRSGKSTILNQIRKNIDSYYMNFDDERFINFKLEDFQIMYELMIEIYGEKEIFIFDEIQNIKTWERFVRRLHDEDKKIFITGSNSSMLSRELGTHLTGRHLAYSLYPFSFKEFIKFKKQKIDLINLSSKEKSKIKGLFNEYIIKGGFPEYLQTEKDEYLKTVYENIIYRDIITRYNLPNEKPLKEIVHHTISNVGKEISFNQLRKLTQLTSATTVKEYFSYLENSYFCFLISRYDHSIKKQAYYNKKIYFIDTAMIKILGFRTSRDHGRILENTVFLELKRRNKEIYFHKDKYECDFIIKEGITIIEALQVTQNLLNNKVREINGILEAMKKYKLKKGLILTEDQEETIIIENKEIIIKPIWKWLLNNS